MTPVSKTFVIQLTIFILVVIGLKVAVSDFATYWLYRTLNSEDVNIFKNYEVNRGFAVLRAFENRVVLVTKKYNADVIILVASELEGFNYAKYLNNGELENDESFPNPNCTKFNVKGRTFGKNQYIIHSHELGLEFWIEVKNKQNLDTADLLNICDSLSLS